MLHPTVDDIRNLLTQVRFRHKLDNIKFIFDEVHMLSSAAFNAFLKTLEEPPKHAIFILATTENIKLFQRYFLVVKYLISKELP
jgi:DNA polymerase-3 subunit gamma/tau